MGVDITITLAHRLPDLSLQTVSRQFCGLDKVLTPMAEFWSGELPLTWRDASHPDYIKHLYEGSVGFSLAFGPEAVFIHHVCRFRHFARNGQARTLIREFARTYALVLSGHRAIYAPDEGIGEKIENMVLDGSSLAGIETALLRLCPPADTFDELADRQQPPWTKPSYFIDAFHDLAIPEKNQA